MGNNEYNEKTAKNYDRVLAPFLNPIRKTVVETIKQLKAEKIIDLCCGTGNQLKFLKKAGFDQIHGVDLSPEMLAQTQVGETKVSCKLEDASQTSFQDGYFDLAMISFALHEKPFDLAQKIIDEAIRITKKGGYLLIVDYVKDRKTYFPGVWGTWAVERMAGGEHYQNYKNFFKKGAIPKLTENLKMIKDKRFLFGAICLQVFEL